MNESDIKHYRRSQLDLSLTALGDKLPMLPKKGWIAEIRSLLLMTTTQLAQRIGVAQSVVSNFEKSEREKTITLHSLEKIANALECDLHYFFVPKKGLESELLSRAEAIYIQNEKELEHHMRLEGQGTSARDDVRKSIQILKLYKEVWNKK